MKRSLSNVLVLGAVLIGTAACDAKKDPVSSGREAVKEVVTQPFNTLDSAKESLTKSTDRSKAAIEELDKAAK